MLIADEATSALDGGRKKLPFIKLYCSAHYALICDCKFFNFRIMRTHEGKYILLLQIFYYSDTEGCSFYRIRTCSYLIYNDKITILGVICNFLQSLKVGGKFSSCLTWGACQRL